MTATYIALATITLTGPDAEIIFGSIPNTFRDLLLVGNYGASASNAGLSQVQFNGDTAASYSDVWMANRSDTGQAISGANSAQNSIRLYRNEFDANTLSHAMTMQIMDYSATNKHKTCLIRNGTVTVSTAIGITSRWGNNNAIQTIRLFTPNTFLTGSTFSLFGIA